MYQKVCPVCFAVNDGKSAVCSACGAPMPNKNPGGSLPEGLLLNDTYRVGAFISIDSEGAVYDATEISTGRACQIKEYMPVTLCSGRGAQLELQVRVGSEVPYKNNASDFADLYARLRHFNNDICLVGVREVFYANNTVYAVTEKPEGLSLTQYLEKRGGRIGWDEALDLLDPLWLSVERLHRAGIIHRGICPDNITVTGPGVVRLGGFATQAMRSQGTELKAQLYPGYAAPEQYTASAFDGPFTDIYALSAVLYRVVTGVSVPTARERLHEDTLEDPTIYTEEPLPDGSVQRLPLYLADVILHGLQLDGAERFADMAAFRAALAGQQPQQPARRGAAAAVKTEPARGGFWSRLGTDVKVALCTGLFLLLVFAVVLIVWYSGRSKAPVEDETSSVSVTDTSSEMPDDTSESEESDPDLVPNLVGQRYAEARLAYSDIRFEVTYDYSSVYEAGVIMRQSPEADEPMTDNIISIVVSQGTEPIPLPDLEGSTGASAESILNGLGIKYTVVVAINDGSYAEGVVIETNPGAGTLVQPGIDTVILRVASARPAESSSEQPSESQSAPASSSENAEDSTSEADGANGE